MNGVGDAPTPVPTPVLATAADQLTGTNGAYLPGVWQQGFQVGLRHMF